MSTGRHFKRQSALVAAAVTICGSASSAAEIQRDSAIMMRSTAQLIAYARLGDYLYAGKILTAETSQRQLLEVVTDLWENHFSIYSGKVPDRVTTVAWDRGVIRPRAFGSFRDPLSATAHSPAMLSISTTI